MISNIEREKYRIKIKELLGVFALFLTQTNNGDANRNPDIIQTVYR